MAKVLVADDSDAIRQVLHDIISIGKHELVGEAIDGIEAVEKFNEIQPDLLLLDLAMPKKDGLTAVKEIMEFNPDARIILITASDNQFIITQCLEAGAIASISKPFDFDKVLQVISDAQKLELGKLVVKKENQNIKDTIDVAVQAFQPRATENNITIKHNLDKEILVPHDRERITQVLTNLLKNALDVVNPGTGIIEVIVEDSDLEIKINVTDNGPGIPKEKQSGLFKKFYQVDTSLTRESGGSGLGLAICKGLVEEHGGSISAESTLGVGTTFSFILPKKLRTSEIVNHSDLKTENNPT